MSMQSRPWVAPDVHGLPRLIALDRHTRIEQHALRAESLVQSGISYDLEDSRVQPYQPYRGTALGRTLWQRLLGLLGRPGV